MCNAHNAHVNIVHRAVCIHSDRQQTTLTYTEMAVVSCLHKVLADAEKGVVRCTWDCTSQLNWAANWYTDWAYTLTACTTAIITTFLMKLSRRILLLEWLYAIGAKWLNFLESCWFLASKIEILFANEIIWISLGFICVCLRCILFEFFFETHSHIVQCTHYRIDFDPFCVASE